MLKRRDNLGSDAVALPSRNIFAAPVGASAHQRASGGGVFGAAAACRTDGSESISQRSGVAAAARPTAITGHHWVAPIACMLAGVAAVAVALVPVRSDGEDAAPRSTPNAPPADVQRGSAPTDRPRSVPRAKAPKSRPRRARRAGRARPRPRRPLRQRAVPRRAPMRPGFGPPGVRPTAPRSPAPAPKPAGVPPDSPPEFM